MSDAMSSVVEYWQRKCEQCKKLHQELHEECKERGSYEGSYPCKAGDIRVY